VCGIAGYLIDPGRGAPAPDRIVAMLARIGHRGPDEAGYRIDDRGGVGAVRLSILDLESGRQPLADATGRWWIVYNGEVYNYLELRKELQEAGRSFATDCDTEVVLQAWLHWGADCLTRFDGAFAFAVWDAVEGRLILARDRYGKRPLYYARGAEGWVFASEMKAFLAWEGFSFAPDAEQVASILGHWTPLPEQTGFVGVAQVPMASWLEVEAGGVPRIQVYDRLDFSCRHPDLTQEEAARLVHDAVVDAVRLRLRSDVEVGVYLSGGLDSSIVTAVAAQLLGRAPRTFSVEFDDPDLDESRFQRIASRHLGTEHQALRVTARDIVTAFPEAVWHAECPSFRTAFVPLFLLSQRVRAGGIKTVLSGEGADEVFLGYGLFRETLLRRQWADMDNERRKSRIALLNPYLGHYSEANHGSLLGLYQQFTEERMPGLFSHELRFQNGRFATRLLRDAGPDPFAPLSRLIAAEPGYGDLGDVEKAQWLEFRTLLAGYLLSTQGDRMGMAHGVENRCPFLDPAVVGLAGSVNLRFDGGWGEKSILKQAFAADLPEAVLTRHKHPYRAPDAAAFIAHRPDYLDALLSEDELNKIDLLDVRFAQALCRKVLTSPPERIGTRENQAFIYLLSFVLLYRQFVLGEGRNGDGVAALTARLGTARDDREARR
jgi:asparagine synthase (glutamine-hydrolysing)